MQPAVATPKQAVSLERSRTVCRAGLFVGVLASSEVWVLASQWVCGSARAFALTSFGMTERGVCNTPRFLFDVVPGCHRYVAVRPWGLVFLPVVEEAEAGKAADEHQHHQRLRAPQMQAVDNS